MDGGIIVLIVIASLALLALDYYIAKEFNSIAEEKGADDKRYFWWCFFTGFIGILMVIALPDKVERIKIVNDNKSSQSDNKKYMPSDELPDL